MKYITNFQATVQNGSVSYTTRKRSHTDSTESTETDRTRSKRQNSSNPNGTYFILECKLRNLLRHEI